MNKFTEEITQAMSLSNGYDVIKAVTNAEQSFDLELFEKAGIITDAFSDDGKLTWLDLQNFLHTLLIERKQLQIKIESLEEQVEERRWRNSTLENP